MKTTRLFVLQGPSFHVLNAPNGSAALASLTAAVVGVVAVVAAAVW